MFHQKNGLRDLALSRKLFNMLYLNNCAIVTRSIIMSMKKQDICEVKSVHKTKVSAVRKAMLSDYEVNSLAETFSVMSDPTRTKIIYALSKEELCVCDIARVLGISISAISHQLRILRNMRLVKFRREAKMVYYSLDDRHINRLFNEGLKHIRE
jgi:ArsR family transcriptional regulator